MDCGGVFVKYVLFIFNILFVICGILLIIFGSIMLSSIGDIKDVVSTYESHSVPIAVLVLGCIIFVISFLGCCGAIRENSCCTMTYSVIMFLLFLCQLALVIIIWVKRQDILNAMNYSIKTIWDQRQSDRSLMDGLELSLKCCGYNGPTDYTGESVPKSCCGASATNCSIVEALLRPGCLKAFDRVWTKNFDIIRYAGLGVAGIELVAFIFACCLANQVRNNARRSNF
ncbi:23 kDa integral membrane protein-like [Stomoxys calcitrans]|uniref:Tetraspanin n=1 Tax=Stomoxys calcitrans TaxID=35570 RepID=A0A1I8QAH3_STOCA|nr:23 kDa integral membrane protein-like [Stomoxys calcitrans]